MISVNRGLAFHTNPKTLGIDDSTPGASFNRSDSDGVLFLEEDDCSGNSGPPAFDCGVSGICGSVGLSNFQIF